ncbi:MAG: hypothetical protein WCB31_02170 [Nitrososphaeraceae archaeon]
MNSYWKKSIPPEKYFEAYSNLIKIITQNSIDTARMINDILLEKIETFSRTIETVQRYYTSFIENFKGSSYS